MTIDQLQIHLPKYLSVESKNALLDGLKSFPEVNSRFYTTMLNSHDTVFQGDGLSDCTVVNVATKEFKSVDVMVLSNTCDIAPENTRHFESQIVYAPIINLAKYTEWLEKKGVAPGQVKSHREAITSQGITQIMYLPEQHGIIEDSIVFLDRINHSPATTISPEETAKKRIFTLSNYGHYLFLFKLSFHFCRFQDKVDRDAGSLN